MEEVNKQRRNFISLSELEYGPLKFSFRRIRKCRVIISVRKKAQKGSQIYSKAVKKSRKRSGFVIYSYFKCSAFTLVERDAKF